MSLPATRTKTFTDGGDLFVDDLNDMQDQLIAAFAADSAVEATRGVGDNGQPAFASGWSNHLTLGVPTDPLVFYKDRQHVHITGRIISGSGKVFTLPAGYLPPAARKFTNVSVSTNGLSVVEVAANGDVTPVSGGDVAIAILFRVAP